MQASMLSAVFSNVNSTTWLMSKGSLLVSCNSSAIAIQELCNPPKNHRRGWKRRSSFSCPPQAASGT
ncbi:hypothetical protein IG631_07381 [Alternaria alternata]|nr:hypothetical protein IG631_07381 [Alternaria alternata]